MSAKIGNFCLKKSFGNFVRKVSGYSSELIFGHPPNPRPSLRPCTTAMRGVIEVIKYNAKQKAVIIVDNFILCLLII